MPKFIHRAWRGKVDLNKGRPLGEPQPGEEDRELGDNADDELEQSSGPLLPPEPTEDNT